MKDALKSKKEILDRLRRAKQAALFLDFDGTLSPIVRDPGSAKIPGETRVLVEKLAERMHVYVVTGRALKDIRARAPLTGVEYAGNHGLEYTREGRAHRGRVSSHALEDIRQAVRASKSLSAIAGAFAENKKYSVSFHYRNVAAQQVPEFMRIVKAILWPIVARGRTEVLEQKKVIEIRVRGANKGAFVLAALKRLPKGALGIYVGDDTTDEDAFKALQDGITIRVGEKKESAAQYFVESQTEVVRLLEMLLQ
ncbi:MAG TPA: trehalose-phosphatase [Candidatus Paceibacterota bacterium]|nr:trehalose-phosphatase [Candidatus Paceibacterota bacterium]